jgi:hypothetical protein
MIQQKKLGKIGKKFPVFSDPPGGDMTLLIT